MPNWAQNVVTFRHEDPEMIRRAVQGFNGEGLMGEFLPIPTKLVNTVSGSFPADDPRQAELERQQAANLEEFGFEDWYDWAMEHWGVKWDVRAGDDGDEAFIGEDGKSTRLSFNTAWNPPLAFYGKMEELGFSVDAYYYEPGMAFCGHYFDGEDAEFRIPSKSADAEKAIPEDIDEMFAIVENMAEWEAEEAEWEANEANKTRNEEEA